MYNKKERKRIAKQLGFTKQSAIDKNKDPNKTRHEKYCEVLERSINAGKQIHTTNNERVLNDQIKAEAEAEQRQLENMMKPITDKRGKILKEGMTFEEASKIIEDNRNLKNK